jgi:hypothetical protein
VTALHPTVRANHEGCRQARNLECAAKVLEVAVDGDRQVLALEEGADGAGVLERIEEPEELKALYDGKGVTPDKDLGMVDARVKLVKSYPSN